MRSSKIPSAVISLALAILLCCELSRCANSRNNSTIDWTLERQGGRAVLLIGRLTVVFENVPMKGGDQQLATGFFNVPAPGETREPLSGGRSVNELTIRESWQDGVNTIQFNDYSFQLVENGTRLKFGDHTFAIGDEESIVVEKDGSLSTRVATRVSGTVLGAHWGAWATAVVALVAGLVLILRSRHVKKWNHAAAGGLVLVLAAMMFWNGWRAWPQQTAQHFISVVSRRQHDEVRAMLTEPAQWTVGDNADITILAEDSSTATLPREDTQLVASGGPDNVPVPSRSWGEIFAARVDFQLGSFTRPGLTVLCTAERGRVRIRHVEKPGD